MAEEQRNAAQELHDLLSAWQVTPGGSTTLSFRKDAEGRWTTPHVRAVVLLNELVLLTRGLNPGHALRFEKVAERILAGIFATGVVMSSPTTANMEMFSDGDLSAVEMLQYVTPAAPAINAGAAADLLGAARQAEDLVASATHLDADAQRYLLELTTHLEKAVQQIGAFGGAEVRRLASELAGALAAYFTDAPPDEAERARGLVRRMVDGVRDLFVRDFAPTAVKAIASTADQWMLPPGAGS